jgi:hypothetical protein
MRSRIITGEANEFVREMPIIRRKSITVLGRRVNRSGGFAPVAGGPNEGIALPDRQTLDYSTRFSLSERSLKFALK